jgi:hypothetical protein
MGERMGRIGQIETDFFLSFHRKLPTQKIPTEGQSVTQKIPTEGQSATQKIPTEGQSAAQKIPTEGQSAAQKIPTEGQKKTTLFCNRVVPMNLKFIIP